jgi:hypothetical protein
MEVNTSTTADTTNIYDYINGFFMNPSAFIIVGIVLVAYFIVFSSLGNNSNNSNTSGSFLSEPNSNNSQSSNTILIVIVVIVCILLLLVNGLQYFFGIDMVASVKQLFLGNPQIDITLEDTNKDDEITGTTTVPEIKYTKQVFNIPGNSYGYEDAKTLCLAYGGRLANYQEVENTYNEGGEWCNYGWSEGQMALFPTQSQTYKNLQKIEGHENDCGRPGVNGGYMANPHLKFGVNCYGYKPQINDEEEYLMQVTTPYPKTEKDILFEKRVNYWKSRINEILVSPFNYQSWSKI